MFSAACIVWTAARYPDMRQRLRPLTRRMVIHQNGAVGSAMVFAVSAFERASGTASFAAGLAAAEAASGVIEVARGAFVNGVEIDAALTDDFASLLTRATPAALAGRELWVNSTPRQFSLAKELLYESLSKRANWNVWTDWYESRVHGGLSSKEIEVDRAEAVGVYPKANIKSINLHIKEKIDNPTLNARWARDLAALKQTPFGAKFIQDQDQLTIDYGGDESDVAVSKEPITSQLHDGIKRRANEFLDIARRVDNQIGWKGLGAAAVQFSESIECATQDVPSRIGMIYDSTISLGSFLDLDTRLRKSSDRSNADPLDLEVQRAFINLVRSAAPWLRRFPTARMLDEEAGAFLTRTNHFEAAAKIVEIAESYKSDPRAKF